MNKNIQNILVAVACGIGFALAAMIAVFIPIIGLLILCLPVPYVVIMFRRGIWPAVIAVLISALIYGLFLNFYAGVLLAFILPVVLAVYYIAQLDNAVYEKISIIAGAIALAALAGIWTVNLIIRADVLTMIMDDALTMTGEVIKANHAALSEMMGVYVQAGLLEKAMSEQELIRFMQSSLKDMVVYAPAVFIASCVIMAISNLGLLSFIDQRKKLSQSITQLPAFSDWELPRGTSAGFLLLFILSFLFMSINGTMGHQVFVTVSGLFMFVFSLQGLSVADCFLKSKGIGTPLRVTLLVITIIIFSMLLYIVGIFDQLFKIRQNIEKKNHIL